MGKQKHQGSDSFSVFRFAFYRDVDSVVRMAQKLLPAVVLLPAQETEMFFFFILFNMWDIARYAEFA